MNLSTAVILSSFSHWWSASVLVVFQEGTTTLKFNNYQSNCCMWWRNILESVLQLFCHSVTTFEAVHGKGWTESMHCNLSGLTLCSMVVVDEGLILLKKDESSWRYVCFLPHHFCMLYIKAFLVTLAYPHPHWQLSLNFILFQFHVCWHTGINLLFRTCLLLK